MEGKAIIVSAPSGAGKTTIVKHLLNCGLPLEFSISACSRSMRPGEIDGKDYYFLGPEEFKKRIAHDEYGTLKSEISRIWEIKKHVIFDVDVKGGVNLKKKFGQSALSIFIGPPSYDSLRDRLIARGTESPASLEKRLERAKLEMTYSNKFDITIINNVLSKALEESEMLVRQFIYNQPE